MYEHSNEDELKYELFIESEFFVIASKTNVVQIGKDGKLKCQVNVDAEDGSIIHRDFSEKTARVIEKDMIDENGEGVDVEAEESR